MRPAQRLAAVREILAPLGVFAVYVLAGKAGLALAFVNASASAVWPPTGVAIASLLLLGTRLWPAILLGAFVVNVTTTGSIPSSLGIAIGNSLEAIIAARLVIRLARGRHVFERPQDVLKFTFFAILSTTVSATIGTSALAASGRALWDEFAPIWLTWWLGDASGALVVAPVIVLWGTPAPAAMRGLRVLAFAVLAAATIAVALVTFNGFGPLSLWHYPVSFLPFPVLVWAAFRFSPREAATCLAVLSGVAIAGTLGGTGPFGALPANDALVLLQAFMAVAALTTLTLAAAVLDRDRAQDRARATEERLRLAEERKVAEREEFLSVAAHELKTPMTSLQIAVQTLLRQIEREGTLEPDRLSRGLAAIGAQTDRLGRLAIELLESVRAQGRRLELNVAESDIVELVASALERARARSNRNAFTFASPPPPLAARVDRLRIEQVLDNILDNAVKFSPEGGVIDVSVGTTPSGAVGIAVRDHGVGIPPERRARIFERFYQAHAESQRSGLGLGLYVSREIVDLHGGTIAAEFPDDGGTRIVIELPLVAARAERDAAVAVRS